MKKKVKKLTSIHQSKQNAWIEPHSMSNRKRNGMEIKYSMVRKEESKDKVLNNKKPSRVRRKIASHYGLAQMVKNLPAMQETRFNPWIRKIPWRSEWLPTPILLPWGIPWTEEPGGLQSMGSQSQTTERPSLSLSLGTSLITWSGQDKDSKA